MGIILEVLFGCPGWKKDSDDKSFERPQHIEPHGWQLQKHFLEWKFQGPIDNESALIQAMYWCWTGNKLVPESWMTIYEAKYVH